MVVTNAGRSIVLVRFIQLEYFANLELNKVHLISLHFEYRTHTGRAFAVLHVTLSQNSITGSPTSSSPAIISLPKNEATVLIPLITQCQLLAKGFRSSWGRCGQVPWDPLYPTKRYLGVTLSLPCRDILVLILFLLHVPIADLKFEWGDCIWDSDVIITSDTLTAFNSLSLKLGSFSYSFPGRGVSLPPPMILRAADAVVG